MILIIFFSLGLIMGSFFNVVGYRLPKGESIVKPPSHCPECQHQLTALELIPVISYCWQRGKCRYCKTKIPLFYPVFELLTGLLFVCCYLIFGLEMELLVALIFVSTLLISTIADFKYLIIPDEVLLGGGVMIFIVRLTMGYPLIKLLFMALIPFGVMFLIKLIGDYMFKKESLGGADIKLMLIFGLVIGAELTVVSVFLASFIALPMALIVLKKYQTNIIPFGPFLGLAALIMYFYQLDPSLLWELFGGGM